MATATQSFLLKFRSQDSPTGVTRGTVEAMAKKLGVSETQVVHLALSNLASEVFPPYKPDEGTLSARAVRALCHDAAAHLPLGNLLSSTDLFH